MRKTPLLDRYQAVIEHHRREFGREPNGLLLKEEELEAVKREAGTVIEKIDTIFGIPIRIIP